MARNFRLFKNLYRTYRISTTDFVKEKPLITENKFELTKNGAINALLIENPGLDSKPNLASLFDNFLANGFKADKISLLVQKCPEILNVSPNRILDSLNGWLQCQFGDEHCCELLMMYPHLLFITKLEIEERHLKVADIFLHRSLYKAVRNAPQIMIENWDYVLTKLKYLETDLSYKKSEIATHGALSHPLTKLKERFEFLLRAGIFKIPKTGSNKDRPINPSMSVILNTDDVFFATKVANLTLLEFEVFKELIKEEWLEDMEENL